MMDSIGKASNIGSVLMNRAVVKRVGIVVDEKSKKATKIVAELKNKNEAEGIMGMFQKDFGCHYGCPSLGIEADKEKGLVIIDGEKVHDREAFDWVVGTLVTAMQIFSK